MQKPLVLYVREQLIITHFREVFSWNKKLILSKVTEPWPLSRPWVGNKERHGYSSEHEEAPFLPSHSEHIVFKKAYFKGMEEKDPCGTNESRNITAYGTCSETISSAFFRTIKTSRSGKE